jgi:hypothetical protein
VAAALTFATPSPAAAAGECGVTDPLQNVYVGPNGGSWTDLVNWSRNALPSTGNTCVPGGKIVVVPDDTTMVMPGSDTIGTLRIVGTVRIQETDAVVRTNWAYGGTNLVNSGRIELTNGAVLDLSPDQNGAPAFVNNPGAVLAASGGARFSVLRPLANNGSVVLSSGATMSIDGAAAVLIGGSGSVTGGVVRLNAGTVRYSTGPLQVFATGGNVEGTIAATNSLDMACNTASAVISLRSVVNNGTIRMRPPLTPGAACSVTFSVPGGTTLRNAGRFVVGDPGRILGPGHYGSFFYDSSGTFQNSAGGKVIINDAFGTNIGQVVNAGRVEVAKRGAWTQNAANPVVNRGTLITRGTLDLAAITNSGTLDLQSPTGFRGAVVLTPSSTLRVRASKSALTGITALSIGSKLDGTLHVVTSAKKKPPRGWQETLITPGAHTSGRFDEVRGAIPRSENTYRVVYKGTPTGGIDLRVVPQ